MPWRLLRVNNWIYFVFFFDCLFVCKQLIPKMFSLKIWKCMFLESWSITAKWPAPGYDLLPTWQQQIYPPANPHLISWQYAAAAGALKFVNVAENVCWVHICMIDRGYYALTIICSSSYTNTLKKKKHPRHCVIYRSGTSTKVSSNKKSILYSSYENINKKNNQPLYILYLQNSHRKSKS